MFDAALGVRHDGSSQGGYIIMLTHKSAFEGAEVPYHVLDWRSFRLPRVCRSSLSAEVQSAAQAIDSTEFVIRFWHMVLNPNATLRQTLDVSKPTLSPTFITDAKALYDSYHRDAINHGATDKRTNLELRVIREQVEGVGGVLKWISSERQFGDGFTKMAARQLLADRLRHGSIKFTWDPEYQASKKKTAAEREKSRNEFTTTTTKTTHNHHKPHTTEQEDAHDDEAPATNADENMTVEPYVTDPNLTFENAQLSVDADVTLNVQTPEDVRFMEEIYDIETNAAHGEPFVLPNNQVPVEAYSLSHGGAGAMLKYVFMATAFCTAESVKLEVQARPMQCR